MDNTNLLDVSNIYKEVSVKELIERPGSSLRWAKRVDHRSLEQSIVDETVYKKGLPLVISNTTLSWRRDRDLFSWDWLKKNFGKATIRPRDNDSFKDLTHWTVSEYVDYVLTPKDQRNPRHLYGKDVPCPPAWKEYVAQKLNNFFCGSSGDLIAELLKQLQPETLLIYLGTEDTYTPGHTDIMGSLGNNVMVYADEGAYSLWCCIATEDRNKAAAFWRQISNGQGSLYSDNVYIPLEELAKAPFPVYIIEQKEGDFVLIPPDCAHQVMNKGGNSIKVAWNTIYFHNIEHCYYQALPLYRSLGKPEIYRIKSIAYYSLINRSDAVEQNRLTDNIIEEFPPLLNIVQDLILSEWVNVPTEEEEELEKFRFTDDNMPHTRICDFCKCDIWNRCYHCSQCGEENGYDICLACVAEGRGCPHKPDMVLMEYLSMQSIKQEFERAKKAYEKLVKNNKRKRSKKKAIVEWKPKELPDTERSLGTMAYYLVKMYTKENKDEACHQCEKIQPFTQAITVSCSNQKNNNSNSQCGLKYCTKCLWNRYGIKLIDILKHKDWSCPQCKGECNCNPCLEKSGKNPSAESVLGDLLDAVYPFQTYAAPNIPGISDFKPVFSSHALKKRKFLGSSYSSSPSITTTSTNNASTTITSPKPLTPKSSPMDISKMTERQQIKFLMTMDNNNNNNNNSDFTTPTSSSNPNPQYSPRTRRVNNNSNNGYETKTEYNTVPSPTSSPDSVGSSSHTSDDNNSSSNNSNVKDEDRNHTYYFKKLVKPKTEPLESNSTFDENSNTSLHSNSPPQSNNNEETKDSNTMKIKTEQQMNGAAYRTSSGGWNSNYGNANNANTTDNKYSGYSETTERGDRDKERDIISITRDSRDVRDRDIRDRENNNENYGRYSDPYYNDNRKYFDNNNSTNNNLMNSINNINNNTHSYNKRVDHHSTLLVRNLSYSCTVDDLRNLFAPFGSLENVTIPVDKESGRMKGYGFIKFKQRDDAERALKDCNKATVRDRSIEVEWSVDKGTQLKMALNHEMKQSCFRCGRDGHIAKFCPFEEVPKNLQRYNRGGGGAGGDDRYGREREDRDRMDRMYIDRERDRMDRERDPHNRDNNSMMMESRDSRDTMSRDDAMDVDRKVHKGYICFKCGKDGHVALECPEKNINGPGFKGAVCFKCGIGGHLASQCVSNRKGCFICGHEGHIAVDCSERFNKSPYPPSQQQPFSGDDQRRPEDIPKLASVDDPTSVSMSSSDSGDYNTPSKYRKTNSPSKEPIPQQQQQQQQQQQLPQAWGSSESTWGDRDRERERERERDRDRPQRKSGWDERAPIDRYGNSRSRDYDYEYGRDRYYADSRDVRDVRDVRDGPRDPRYGGDRYRSDDRSYRYDDRYDSRYDDRYAADRYGSRGAVNSGSYPPPSSSSSSTSSSTSSYPTDYAPSNGYPSGMQNYSSGNYPSSTSIPPSSSSSSSLSNGSYSTYAATFPTATSSASSLSASSSSASSLNYAPYDQTATATTYGDNQLLSLLSTMNAQQQQQANMAFANNINTTATSAAAYGTPAGTATTPVYDNDDNAKRRQFKLYAGNVVVGKLSKYFKQGSIATKDDFKQLSRKIVNSVVAAEGERGYTVDGETDNRIKKMVENFHQQYQQYRQKGKSDQWLQSPQRQ